MSLRHLACLGGDPEFKRPIPIGQLYFPDWKSYEMAMREVFEQNSYTDNGPLIQKLELKLAEFLNVKHVICVTNATIGLIVGAEALNLSGKVLMPAFTFIATALSLSRCGIEPIFCDIDPRTLHITPHTLANAYETGVTGVLGVNLWGSAADHAGVEAWANDRGLMTFWDSAQAMGCTTIDGRLGGCGNLEVFSMHATKVLSAGEGGCITTNDSAIALRVRNILMNNGCATNEHASGIKTVNGRMSELQAAIALLSLRDYDKNVAHNFRLREIYVEALFGIDGIEVEPLYGISKSNGCSLIVRIDEERFGVSCDILATALEAENVLTRRYFEPGSHRVPQFACRRKWELPHTDNVQRMLLALPLGFRINVQAASRISALVSEVYKKSRKVLRELR